MTKDELIKQKEALQTAITNVLEAGEEFQTRNGRVKQTSLSSLQAQLASIETQLAQYGDNTMATTEIFTYGGCR